MASFRLCSFNVYNLVRPGVPYYSARAYGEDEHHEKTSWIGAMLRHVDPHLAGFQEVFHEDSLREAVAKSGLFADLDQVIAPGATPEANEIEGKAVKPRVGLASRFPLRSWSSIETFPDSARLRIEFDEFDTLAPVEIPIGAFQRPPLRAEVELPNGEAAIVYVAHLKSKRPLLLGDEDRSDPMAAALGAARALLVRACEAAALRCLILEDLQRTRTPLIVLGDLNDGVPSVSTQIVAGEPPYFRLPVSRKRPIWDVLLYSAADIQARQSYRDVGYTHIYNGRHEVLDHILVSEEFVRANPRHIGYVLNQQIFNDHIFDETISERRKDRTRSDHGVPVAEVRMRRTDDD